MIRVRSDLRDLVAFELEKHPQPRPDLSTGSARTCRQHPDRYHPLAPVTKRLGVELNPLPTLVVVGREGCSRPGPSIDRVLERSSQGHDLNVIRRVGLQGVDVARVEPLDHPVR